MKELLNFDWLLRVKKSDPFFILIIFQPLYIIWIYKVGRLGEKMLIRKRNWLFSLSCFWVLISIFLFIIILENKDLLNYLGNYKEDLFLVFGKESKGLPESITSQNKEQLYKIPLYSQHIRSLNLANAVSVVVYEGLRNIKI